MSHTPHELAEEFPEYVETMHRLKTEDAHFARLFEEYHDINRAVHRAETNVEPTDDAHENELRKQRMALKDQLYAMLAKG
ncbi:MAG: YdcH family protein [Rhodobacteraceae bacterium]|nr:YdcH family protein [Paracoccaceae bacterium]